MISAPETEILYSAALAGNLEALRECWIQAAIDDNMSEMLERLNGRAPLSPLEIEPWSAHLELERLRRYTVAHKIKNNTRAKAAFLARSAANPVWWANSFLWTYHPEERIKNQPFVLWEWQADLFLAVLGRVPWSLNPDGTLRSLIVDKSRKMGVTYVVLAAFLWAWLFEAQTKQGLVSRAGPEVWDDTEDSLFGKLRQLYEHLPSWMRVGPWRDIFKQSPRTVLTNPLIKSVIIGSKQSKDVFRGGRHKRDFVDEAASIPHLRLVLKSVDEVGPSVLVSTPKGMGNHFARLVHRKTTDAVVSKGATDRGRVHVRYHYDLDPRKDPEWKADKQAELSDEAWAEEYEIDYHASAPGRIWPDFRREVHLRDDAQWLEIMASPELAGATYIEGWDFGTGLALTAVVWAAYVEATDTLYLLDYREWQRTPYETIAQDVGRAGWYCSPNRSGRRPHYRVGDISGKAKDSDQRSWLENLESCGIVIDGQGVQYGRIEWAIGRIAKAMRDERFVCAPGMARAYNPDLPSGVEVLEQYQRGKDNQSVDDFEGENQKPRKNKYSHLADAIQHVALVVWPFVQTRTREQD